MVFKLIVGVMKPFVKQRTMQNHSIKNKRTEEAQNGDGSGGGMSVVCKSYFPAVPTTYSIPSLFCGMSRFWRTRFEKCCYSELPTLRMHFVVSASQDY